MNDNGKSIHKPSVPLCLCGSVLKHETKTFEKASAKKENKHEP